MSARAGWYAVPAEPGTMRYWDGSAWTEHRQPLPPPADSVPIAAPAPAAPAPAAPAPAAPAPAAPAPTALAPAAVATTAASTAWSPAPLSPRPSTPYPAGAVTVPQPSRSADLAARGTSTTGVTPYPSLPPGFNGPTGPVAVVPPQLAGVAADLWASASRYAASEQGRSAGATAVGGALVADGIVGFGRNREGIGGAVKMMLFGLVFFAVGMLLVKPMLIDAGTVGAGEAKTVGTVTHRNESRDDDGDRLCSPDATFTVDGTVYTTSAGYRSSSCPSVGGSVDVIYDVARPADARIAPDATFRLLGWVFPLAGLLFFVVGLWTAVVRAGQIGVGGALLLRGLRGRRSTAGAGTP
ncbi:DUF2510 domain-containing protein [Cellulomonas sp. H30R-01]|uniref:DUF2510 domain-containing protein n=1 Tax=Cellulomonas sp. H30R-01 TaxID=2704467 RepID=UPI00138D9DA4|nr:DUF2510 domain-containing protein [Cellulomonas sp. H30R-01]QHT57201.1 DUF2510 domain-containing protein [Cellulomonas sp. H30R-01]